MIDRRYRSKYWAGSMASFSTTKGFNFTKGTVLADKYRVVSKLGSGWEGEVYLVKEKNTGIERIAKFFFPRRNRGDRVTIKYAKKMHKLRDCSVVNHYHTQESMPIEDKKVTFLISEYIEGEILSQFIGRQPGKRLSIFQGLHLLYSLAKGVDSIHSKGEYHGDLHSDNVIIRRYGISFDLKLFDMINWDCPKPECRQDDIVEIIRIFYEAIGGSKYYSKHDQNVKRICYGMKRTMILKRFPTIGHLCNYLETMHWN